MGPPMGGPAPMGELWGPGQGLAEDGCDPTPQIPSFGGGLKKGRFLTFSSYEVGLFYFCKHLGTQEARQSGSEGPKTAQQARQSGAEGPRAAQHVRQGEPKMMAK